MPSSTHNTLVEMLRESPKLVPQLVELLHVPVPAYRSVTITESTLDQLQPTEYRADLVVELQSSDGTLSGAIVVEVQLGVDPDKKYSWPVYAVTLRARKRCPACVLVVAPTPQVANWAAAPIDIGLGSGAFSPRVLGPSQVPRITSVEEALRQPALAILSARVHGNEGREKGLPVVKAALKGLASLDPKKTTVYSLFIVEGLDVPILQALEEEIMKQQEQEEADWPPFAQKLIARWQAQGEARGEARGEVRGEARGRAEGKREVLFKLIDHAGISLTEQQRAQVEACTDLDMLDRWVDNALTAKTAEDLFK